MFGYLVLTLGRVLRSWVVISMVFGVVALWGIGIS